MTQATQVINGHTYLVTTDDQGKIISTIGADPPADTPPPDPLQAYRAQVIAMVSRDPATFTTIPDLASALQLLTKSVVLLLTKQAT